MEGGGAPHGHGGGQAWWRWELLGEELRRMQPAHTLGLVELGGLRSGASPDRLPVAQSGEESACEAGDQVRSTGLGKFLRRRERQPTQYSCPERSTDRKPGGLQSVGVAKLDTTEPSNTVHSPIHTSPDHCLGFTLCPPVIPRP